MRKIKVKFDDYEFRIIINALNELRTKKLREGKTTDCIDELMDRLLK